MPEDTKEGREFSYLELLCQLFCRILVRGVLRQSLQSDNGLTAVQLSCLHYLKRHERVNASSIAEGLLISRAAATNLVERLACKGLVTRKVNSEDRRQVLIQLTPQGREVLAQALSKQKECFSWIFRQMKQEDIAALERGLRAFIQAGMADGEMLQHICTRCGVEHMASCPVNLILSDMGIDCRF